MHKKFTEHFLVRFENPNGVFHKVGPYHFVLDGDLSGRTACGICIKDKEQTFGSLVDTVQFPFFPHTKYGHNYKQQEPTGSPFEYEEMGWIECKKCRKLLGM